MTNDMTKGSIARILISFSVPLILSGLLQQLYSWADAFIVGNIEGEAALAAIGATNVITKLLIMTITGFTSGVSILSARCFGQGDHEVQKRILSTFVIVLGGASLLASIGSIVFIDQILVLLKTPQDIFWPSKIYLQIVLTSIPFLSIYNVYSAVLRGIGDSKAPFYSVLLSSASNVVLDILFVGVFHWQVAGAAIATAISQVVMTIFIVWYAAGKYEMLKLGKSNDLMDAQVLRSGCALSMPITIQSAITSGGSLILQNFMNGFGTQTVAAITSAYRIDCIILLPVINLGTGISTVTSQNIGAGETERVKKCLRIGLGMTAVVSLILTGIVMGFGEPLIALFGVTPEAARIGGEFFRAIGMFYLIFGTGMAMRGYLEGSGKVVFSGICAIVTLIVRIALSYILKPLFGNMVIAYAEGFAWCIQLLVYGGYIWFYNRKHNRQELEVWKRIRE